MARHTKIPITILISMFLLFITALYVTTPALDQNKSRFSYVNSEKKATHQWDSSLSTVCLVRLYLLSFLFKCGWRSSTVGVAPTKRSHSQLWIAEPGGILKSRLLSHLFLSHLKYSWWEYQIVIFSSEYAQIPWTLNVKSWDRWELVIDLLRFVRRWKPFVFH